MRRNRATHVTAHRITIATLRMVPATVSKASHSSRRSTNHRDGRSRSARWVLHKQGVAIDFGACTIDLMISDVTYFCNAGTNRLFVLEDNPRGNDGNFDNNTGNVAET